MTQDDIIRMAREAGINNDCDGIWCTADQLKGFAKLVAAHEREECAKAIAETEKKKPVRHADWCASLTQLLLSLPPQPAPCNCKPPKREDVQEPIAWLYDFPHPDFVNEVIRDWFTQNSDDIEREKGFNVRPLYLQPKREKEKNT